MSTILTEGQVKEAIECAEGYQRRQDATFTGEALARTTLRLVASHQALQEENGWLKRRNKNVNDQTDALQERFKELEKALGRAIEMAEGDRARNKGAT